MNHTLEIQLKPTEGALLRTLGLIESRGYRLLDVHLKPRVRDQHQLSIAVNAAGRNVEVLSRQIQRLFDVVSVTASSCFNPQPASEAAASLFAVAATERV